jgi:hypothetical protein
LSEDQKSNFGFFLSGVKVDMKTGALTLCQKSFERMVFGSNLTRFFILMLVQNNLVKFKTS